MQKGYIDILGNLSALDLLSGIKMDFKVVGDSSLQLNKVCSLGNANENAISFCTNLTEKNIAAINRFERSLFFVNATDNLKLQDGIKNNVFVIVNNPRLAFIRALNQIFRTDTEAEIHSTVVLDVNSVIGKNVKIGPYSVIQNCIIGDNAKIGTNVFIGSNVRIGRDVQIKSNTVIGGDGFGYEKNEEGIYEKFPHLGGVVIGDNVHIGSNTCIDKGVLGDTLIGTNCKIDNLVHIAHNVQVGINCMIIAQSEISGSAIIGDNVWIAPGARILDKVTIGSDCFIGIGALATKNVPNEHRLIPSFSIIKAPKNL